MALNFGLLSSGLFPASDAVGEGLSPDANVVITKDQGVNPWVQLERQLVAVATATMTFANIPTGFKEFQVVAKFLPKAAGAGNTSLTFNNDGGNNYTYDRIVDGGGSGTTMVLITHGTTDLPQLCTIYISNSSTTLKVVANVCGGGKVEVMGGRWSGVAEINRIDFQNAGEFNPGTEVTLYGRKEYA